jgi:hypothetical protein
MELKEKFGFMTRAWMGLFVIATNINIGANNE